jgi:hypothetical protein
MPEAPDPAGMVRVPQGLSPRCHLTMRTYKSTHHVWNKKPPIKFTSVGIVVATKVPNLRIDRRISTHSNVRQITFVVSVEAPGVRNSEMLERAGDATALAYLHFIILNYTELPDILVFMDVSPVLPPYFTQILIFMPSTELM